MEKKITQTSLSWLVMSPHFWISRASWLCEFQSRWRHVKKCSYWAPHLNYKMNNLNMSPCQVHTWGKICRELHISGMFMIIFKQQVRRNGQEKRIKKLMLGTQVAPLEAATNHLDYITGFDKDISVMKKQIYTLETWNDDLEASSRRCNLCVTGVKDSNSPVEFMAYPPKTALGLDKSYRSLWKRQEGGLPPWAWIIHYFQEFWEKNVGKARALKQVTTAKGGKICILPVYMRTVMEQCAGRADWRVVPSRPLDNCEWHS